MVPFRISSCVERGECIRRIRDIPSGTKHEYCYAIHAEQNAIIQAAKLGYPLMELPYIVLTNLVLYVQS